MVKFVQLGAHITMTLTLWPKVHEFDWLFCFDHQQPESERAMMQLAMLYLGGQILDGTLASLITSIVMLACSGVC